jgi:hypothetical protein
VRFVTTAGDAAREVDVLLWSGSNRGQRFRFADDGDGVGSSNDDTLDDAAVNDIRPRTASALWKASRAPRVADPESLLTPALRGEEGYMESNVGSKYIRATFLFPLAFALAYTMVQIKLTGTIRDAGFVGLFLGDTVVLIEAIVYLKRYLAKHATQLVEDLAEGFRESSCWKGDAAKTAEFNITEFVFKPKYLAVAAIISAGYNFTVPFGFKVWDTIPEHEPVLQVLLGFYFASFTLLQGPAIWIMGALAFKFRKFGPYTHVTLWDRTSPSLIAMCTPLQAMAVACAVYMAVNVTALSLSLVPDQELMVTGVIALNLLIVLGAVVYPMVPIQKQIASQKTNAMQRLHRRSQRHFQHFMLAGNDEQRLSELNMFKEYQAAQASLAAVWTFPLVGKAAVTLGLSIAASLVPTLIKATVGATPVTPG